MREKAVRESPLFHDLAVGFNGPKGIGLDIVPSPWFKSGLNVTWALYKSFSALISFFSDKK